MDENLENMILEGGGGGQKTESYELMLYVAARHTAIDCWEKRRRKGYLFVIGDEMAYSAVNANAVNALIGDGLQADVPLGQIIDEVSQQYHLYYIIPGGASHGADKQVLGFWREQLGPQRVIQLDSPEDTSQCIALTIGVNEGAISVSEGVEAMRQGGIVSRTIDRVAKTISGGGYAAAGSAPRSEWFVCEQQQIRNIRVHREASLEERAQLSRLLAHCRPVPTPIGAGEEGFLASIERELGTAVAVLSRGPRAQDKCLIRPAW